MDKPHVLEPFPFTQTDLRPDLLATGVEHSLQTFKAWRDANPHLIAQHVGDITESLDRIADQHTTGRHLGRLVLPSLRRRHTKDADQEFVEYFSVHNMAEVPDPDKVEVLCESLQNVRGLFRATPFRRRQQWRTEHNPLNLSFNVLSQFAPEIEGLAEMNWLEARVKRLHSILPEEVIRTGNGMGKVMRTIIGVMAIAAYDVAREPTQVKRDHYKHVIPGAYALGAAYALVDDALQSRAGSSIDPKDKDGYHDALSHSFSSGESLNISGLPDHPLTDELDTLFQALLDNYPFERYRHLYYAIEAMYQAQHRDAQLTPDIVAANGGRRSMYLDMTIKSSMTRVVANILGRRTLSNQNYSRFINSILANQLGDDLEDRVSDAEEGTCTIFTLPYDPESGDPNPLYDVFAFYAYVRHVIWDGHPDAASKFVRFGASEIITQFANNKKQARELLQKYPHTPEIGRLILRATNLTELQSRKILLPDMLLEGVIGASLRERDQGRIDPRTFLSDRLNYINKVVGDGINNTSMLGEIATYSLDAGGKRIRPGLVLMLAEALGIPTTKIEPLLKITELFHSSSLIFDDLPAQDNSALRRGKPTAI